MMMIISVTSVISFLAKRVSLSILMLCFIFCLPTISLGAHKFAYSPFWDFRRWGNFNKNDPLYNDAMNRFSEHDVTALVLVNKNSLPPFRRLRGFLRDACRRGVHVWIRTNRVTPKRGIPGMANGTLDFALDSTIQKESMDYLDALAALSKEFPCLTGIVIGGEEIVGAHMDKAELTRHDAFFFNENGFHLGEKLTCEQKAVFFDWVQEKNNLWYSQIWDYFHFKYPKLQWFIYPSSAALMGGRLSSYPRPAYWDLHDLIVTRSKKFAIITECYGNKSPYGAYHVASIAGYLRDLTKETVPFYILLQGHKVSGNFAVPTYSQLTAHAFAAITNGASGIGYYSIDQETGKSSYYNDMPRWSGCFETMDMGRQFYQLPEIKPTLYVLKPRYSPYWGSEGGVVLDTYAALYRIGFAPGFILEEEAGRGNLPDIVSAYYIPESFKYEKQEALAQLMDSDKPIFFGLDQAERYDQFKNKLTPLYALLNISKAPLKTNVIYKDSKIYDKTTSYAVTWDQYQMLIKWNDPSAYSIAYQSIDSVGGVINSPLAFKMNNLLFLGSSDFSLLHSDKKGSEGLRFMFNILAPYAPSMIQGEFLPVIGSDVMILCSPGAVLLGNEKDDDYRFFININHTRIDATLSPHSTKLIMLSAH